MISIDDVDANGIKCPPKTFRPPIQAQVEKCREFIRARCSKRNSINYKRTSYGLKHDVERWTREQGKTYDQIDDWGRAWTGDYFYVSNGAFIVAALLEGYRAERIRLGPNASFNLSVLRRDRVPKSDSP